MEKHNKKPSPEVKALSLFLMAYKEKDPVYKEKARQINKKWDLVKLEKITKEDYLEEVDKMLDMYGGYKAVIEKTIQHYIDSTGGWKSKGDDEYAFDAKEIAKKMGIK
jgi:hypothetical protein